MIKRDSVEHKEWIRKVLERDSFMCQWCHKKNSLVAHHIKPWNEYPELRLVVGNGLTLCRACHMRHHKNHKGKVQVPWNKGLKTGVGGPKGTKFTEQHKLKLSLHKKNKPSWNKGIPMKEETKEIFRIKFKNKSWIIDPETGKRKWIE